MFVFLHVPKTAGSTLKHVIESQHTKRWSHLLYYGVHLDAGRWHPQEAARTILGLPERRREALEVFCGHVHFGLHRFVPQPTVYYTMLRNPIERAVSHYFYVMEHIILSDRPDGRWDHHPDRQRAEAGQLSFEEYMSSGYCLEMDNGQTRLLAGESGLYDRVPFGQCTEALLEAAKHNLREHIQVVGLTERFDESLLLIQRLCGWKTPYYVKQNVTKKRPRLSDIPPNALLAIQQRTVFDQQIYEYGVQLFQQRVAMEGPLFAGQIHQFQERNRRYGRLVTRWNSVMSQLRRGTRFAADQVKIRHSSRSVERPLDTGA